jgi:hypothetical protein
MAIAAGDIEINGIEELRRELAQIQAELDAGNPSSDLRNAMDRSVKRVQYRMMDYPPQRTGSRYVRTGTLGRRWTTLIVAEGDSLFGKVGNNTEYAPQVQSKELQAKVHEGVWQTDEQVMQEEKAFIEGEFTAMVRRVVLEFGR